VPPAEPLLVVDDVAVRFGGVAALSGARTADLKPATFPIGP
jgi:hypothetical protein